ncbi:uncharacterized protein LOC110022702 isoform X2 [Phalaenopsis equestris]|uniref:uncharacterized protein LOC110022702 isoform X2 n=1 Tax=Phalaenopsis equestris TaxID=78828 RepID=UPI0009E1AB07|nr:uncharacterized protein LOC110022702 isoform X2 [Phalaenopsis equestris]
MAEDVQHSYPNTCCALWIKRSQKLEKSRDALRQSVKILEAQIEKQSVEIAALKKGVENQQMKQGQQKDEIMKEANIKKDLEKQIIDLKAKISSLENIKNLKSVDKDEIGMLKARISSFQEEVKNLKELLELERKKSDCEGRKTESEKKRAAEAWKLLKDEKRIAEEQKCLLEAEKKKSEDFRLCLEKFKVEANELREWLSAETAKGYDAKKQIEVEKLKANGEKKRAELERTKAKKRKKLIEEERKRVSDVKMQASHLCQKLEEERKNRERIQKKLEEFSVVSNLGEGENNVCQTLKLAELKLLKEHLRLERKRVKHAKRVAKQEKYEKRVVAQEVHLLKQNLMQILYRLNMLDGLVSQNVGGIDDVQKTEYKPSEIQYGDPFTCVEPTGDCIGFPVSRGCCSRPKTGINSGLESPVGGSLRKKSQSSAVCSTSIHFSDRKLLGSQGRESFEISTTKLAENAKHSLAIEKFPSEAAQIGMFKSCQIDAKDMDGSCGLNGAGKPCSYLSTCSAFAQVSENSPKKRKIEIYTKSLPSEDKLHSVNGDDVTIVNDRMGNVEQFSLANCSQIPAIFKDTYYRKFSQKEGQSKLCKNNFDQIKNIASMSHHTGKSSVKHDDMMKAGKSMCIYNRESCCIEEVGPNSSEMDIDQEVMSVGNKYAFLQSFENKISGGCLKLLELDNYSDELRYINALEMPISPTLPDIEMSNFQLDGEDGSNAVTDIVDLEICSDNSKSIILTSKELSNNNITQLDVFHDITQDTCLAVNSRSLVFESDSYATKPKAELGRFPCLMDAKSDQQDDCVKQHPAEHNKIELEVVPVSMSRDYKKLQPSPDEVGRFSESSPSQPFHEVVHPRRCAMDNPNLPSHVSSRGIKLNKEKDYQSMNSDFFQNQSEVTTVDDPVFTQGLNLILSSDAEKLNKGNDFMSAENGTGHDIQQPLDSVSMSEVPSLTFSSSGSNAKCLSKVVDETGPGRIICSFTSFSSARNVESVSRIICAFNSVTPLMVSKTNLLIVEVLDRLHLEDLQSEDKVAVFFSLLLGNLSERMSDHCKNIVDDVSFQIFESFSKEIVRAFSTGKAKYVLGPLFNFDSLFCLIERFLITREVLVIGDVMQHPSSFPVFPDHKFHLDVGNNCVLSEDATISQFIAGSTIFASICVAADDIGVLLAFSYKLLHTFQNDTSWGLLALHVFANIFGKRFFNLDNHKFLVTTISSVVSLLEGRLKSASHRPPCYHNSTNSMFIKFSPCKQCPFAADAICMDKLVKFLLDMLEDYNLTENGYPSMNNCFVSLNGSAPTSATKENDSSGAKRKFDVQCDASCVIFRYRELTGKQPNGCSETFFCDFTDIISLVELVGHYMGWEWMHNEAVPRLLKMLDVCVCEEFSAALFVLVGELGRHGTSSGGYQQAGIAELRSNLTKLLDTLIDRKAGLPTQFAAVGAMLNLLPLKFEEILYEHCDLTLDSCESSYIKYIQTWFFKLSGEQQMALKSYFDNENH